MPKAVIFRDSYTTNMITYLSENFSRIVFNKEWDFNFNKPLVTSEKPDIVLYIIVERNLDELLKE